MPAAKPPAPSDRYTYYELAVTNPGPLARFLRAVHGRDPIVLGEDFSGAAALCRAWLESARSARAVAVDSDPPPLRQAPRSARLQRVVADVRAANHPAHVIAATNFPVGYWHTRADLVAYLRHARSRLNPDGIFVCDLYGGPDAMIPKVTTRKMYEKDGTPFWYVWEQRSANPLTGRVMNAIHFRCPAAHGGIRHLKNAFTYDWRLWSIPELREAMTDAGFATTEVHDRLGGAIDGDGTLYVRPIDDPAELDENYVVYVVAR